MTFSISCSPQQLPCIVVKPDNLTPANYRTQGGLEINLQSSLCDALRLPSDAPDTMLDSESPRDRAPLPAAGSTAAAAVGLGDALLCCDDNECSDRESASSALNTPHTHNRLHPRCCCCPLLVHSQHFHHLQCFDTVGWAYKTAACMKLIANQCTAYVLRGVLRSASFMPAQLYDQNGTAPCLTGSLSFLSASSGLLSGNSPPQKKNFWNMSLLYAHTVT